MKRDASNVHVFLDATCGCDPLAPPPRNMDAATVFKASIKEDPLLAILGAKSESGTSREVGSVKI